MIVLPSGRFTTNVNRIEASNRGSLIDTLSRQGVGIRLYRLTNNVLFARTPGWRNKTGEAFTHSLALYVVRLGETYDFQVD